MFLVRMRSTHLQLVPKNLTFTVIDEFERDQMWTSEEKNCIIDLIKCGYEVNSREIQTQFDFFFF